MLDGVRRFAVNNNGGKRNLIASPYNGNRYAGTMASVSEHKEKQRRAFESSAAFDAAGANMAGFSGAQTVVSKNVALGILEEFLPQDRHIRNRIFRDIYYHDAVGGGAVDIYASLPWSDFYLTGLQDREALDVFHKSIESMRLKILLPAITRDYLALGVFIGSTVFNSQENIFSAVIPQNVDFTEIVEVPIYGMDPLITLKVPEATRKLFTDAKDPRAARILASLPQHMAESFRGGSIPLEPENTLYIPRRTLSSDLMGTSYYERILPIHLMEKALFKGSIDQAYRRQRSILHITMGGDGDDYIPTQTDMESQRDLWLAADTDPTGAIIITRTGVSPNEVRDASSFWRIDEIFDFLVTAKYRALSINESFITGDACFVDETIIATELGLKRINQIAGNGANSKAGKFYPINFKVASRYGQGEAKQWLYNGYKPTLKIETKHGNQVKCTYNQPLLVLQDNATDWKRADELQLGDLLCISKQPMVRKAPLELNLPPVILNKNATNQKIVKQLEIMTPELAYFMALIVAEGCIDYYRIRISNSDAKIQTIIDKYLDKLFGLTGKWNIRNAVGDKIIIQGVATVCKQGSHGIEINSKQLATWMNYLGIKSSNTKNGRMHSYYKEVPWAILEADEQSQLAYLAGYLDGDGTITDKGKTIIFYSQSRKNIRQIQILLNSHGIDSHIMKQGRALRLTSENSLELYYKIQPYLISKKLTAIAQTINHDRKYGIPTDYLRKFIAERLIEKHNDGASFKNDSGNIIRINNWGQHNRLPGGYLLYESYMEGMYDDFIDDLQLISKKETSKLRELFALGYRFTPVSSIKNNGKQHVYDLSMKPGTEPAFVANGLIVHNSYNSMDASMSVFIEQMRSFRALLTLEIFYEKIFPAIALANDFTRDQYQVIASKRSRRAMETYFNGDTWVKYQGKLRGQRLYQALCDDTRHGLNFHDRNINVNELAIPHIVWQKHLRPEGDQSYFELLSAMQDKGIPVPLAALSMAGGMDINTILNSMDEEVKLHKKLKKYQDKLAEFKLQPTGDNDGGQESQARAIEALSAMVARPGIKRPVGLLNRQYDERLLPHYQDKNGSYKLTSARGQKQIYEKIAHRLSSVMADRATTENRQVKRQRESVGNRKLMVHSKFGIVK